MLIKREGAFDPACLGKKKRARFSKERQFKQKMTLNSFVAKPTFAEPINLLNGFRFC